MNESGDFEAGLNVIVCLYALGQKDKMRTMFERMLLIPIPGLDVEAQEELQLLSMKNRVDDKSLAPPVIPAIDPLKEYIKAKKMEALKLILQSAKIVAPYIGQDIVAGYDYACLALKEANLLELESEMEIAKSIYFIKNK